MIQMNSSELEQMQELDRGACSTVYKYGADLVIKVLNKKGIELHNEEEFANIIGIENSTCVFPKDRVEIDGIFQGYTMDYVQGEPLHETIKRMDLSTLIVAIKEVENELRQLSLQGVLFQDLNQGGIMWDEVKRRIKIIDTDFFIKDENVDHQKCYNHNIKSFNTMIEMELGILNGQDTKQLEYLMNNQMFSEVYKKYIIASLKGEDMSVTELINKAIEVFENDFGVKVSSIEEMEKLIGERTGLEENTKGIPRFEPPEERKRGIKQKIADFFSNKSFLRKIPFIDRFVLNEQSLLVEANQEGNAITERRRHARFVKELSGNGEYRKMSIVQQIGTIIRDKKDKKEKMIRDGKD